MKELIDIKYWIFDLDNTLYSGQTQVFSEVDKKMSTFISKKMNVDLVKAKEIQKKYFYEYGTTLSGLMKQDGIDPHDFLEFVHDIDISWLPKDTKLREELIKIKEKKIIFTNGSHSHVENVTKQLGINGLFDGAFDIVEDSKSLFSSISFKSVLTKDWSFIGSLNIADISNINSDKFIRNISGIEEFSFDIGLIKKSFSSSHHQLNR